MIISCIYVGTGSKKGFELRLLVENTIQFGQFLVFSSCFKRNKEGRNGHGRLK